MLKKDRCMPDRGRRRLRGPQPEGDSVRPEDIIARAAAVLRENDMGGWTRASPTLYPHQWSWDSAFIAIGLAHLDVGRAAGEIRSLLDHQWENGKIPHIVFNPDAPPESYFPGPGPRPGSPAYTPGRRGAGRRGGRGQGVPA